MRIEFLKMQGLGNDFLVFDAPAAADTHLDSSSAPSPIGTPASASIKR
jgi:diaminopimelate epimerase